MALVFETRLYSEKVYYGQAVANDIIVIITGYKTKNITGYEMDKNGKLPNQIEGVRDKLAEIW
ncbi:MAG: hypothetical protein GX022_08670 [Clostridiaceae bacterium]|nr:hypothetical protein [Clostridiaceae bacterium]